jgi:hypothetical protein
MRMVSDHCADKLVFGSVCRLVEACPTQVFFFIMTDLIPIAADGYGPSVTGGFGEA